MDAEVFARPGHLINRTARLSARWGEVRFRPLGLAVAQIPVLACLKDGKAHTQKELAQMIRIEQPTMAQLLSRMERDGLIARTPDRKDKRSSLISLTPLAQAKLPAARAIMDEGSAIALQGLTGREVATLSKLLTRVMNNLLAATEELEEGDAGVEP